MFPKNRYIHIGLVMIAVAATAMFLYKTYSESPLKGEFGGVSLNIEYAMTEAEQERGLGGRESVPSDYGMLFVFPKAGRYGFWMKDMLVPLDIFWLDSKGHVVSMALDVATSSYPNVFYPMAPARYVLETAAGFARAHTIATGTPLSLKKFPTVSE